MARPYGVMLTTQDLDHMEKILQQRPDRTQQRPSVEAPIEVELLGRKLSILVVEGTSDDGRLVEIALRELPIPTQIARVRSGPHALTQLRGPNPLKPDLVLLDLQLPNMSGRELLIAIREDPELADLPVIILCGLDYEFSIQDIHQLGVRAFVSKPMDITDLDAVARVVLEFWAGVVLQPMWEELSSVSGLSFRR
jgi:CheY-like chemotaxis protein